MVITEATPVFLFPCIEMSEALIRAIKVMLYDEFHAVYSLTEKEVTRRWLFEECISRPYFHCKTLGLYVSLCTTRSVLCLYTARSVRLSVYR